MIRKIRRAAIAALALVALAGCEETHEPGAVAAQKTETAADLPKLGLMTSLPIYWSLDADIANLAQGNGEKPWQRQLLEKQFELVPLDTLTPIPGLSPDEPETNPLAGLDRLAVIQPRGLSPADNVALDEWVRGGGQLLLVVDPMLTGDYELALGDPRRPVDSAPIPPVIERWGMAIAYDEAQDRHRSVEVPFAGIRYGLFHSGEISLRDDSATDCEILGDGAIARCEVGNGRLTLVADAGVFEHQLIVERDFTGERQPVAQLLRFAFQP